MHKKGAAPCLEQRHKFLVLGVTHGVLALPAPGIPAHIQQGLFGLPAQLLSGLAGLCVAGGQVAGTAVNDL